MTRPFCISQSEYMRNRAGKTGGLHRGHRNLRASLERAPVRDHYYYAIENLENGSVVRRGLTSSNGIPRNGLILSPNTHFREWLLQAGSGLVGFSDFRTAASGSPFTIPPIALHPSLSPDTDGDGLSDNAEFIVGSKTISSADFNPQQMDLG